ncbi:hypothetical protein SAMN06295912_10387 [Sphingomonas laterariae]|uniref:Uncharacterized protein n=1 Tax=Edaphosphingomonas laterariae TaxID=861865 RepID=A0A239CYU3_9SPHN|nr:hypothetical protein [Sphingomonas laterariae]SNS24523.1 hypothetical protein SAMN06295912_10387 [Sphingomonas laterariae]
MGGAESLDRTIELEAVYYAAPMPRRLSSLVALGFIFDRIHFPGVYLPQGDYDREAWRHEIARIAGLNLRDHDSQVLLSMMRFSETAEKLAGFLCYDKSRDDPLEAYDVNKELVSKIQEAIWGPPSPNFIPLVQSWHHKSVQGSEEHLTYRGEYHYHAGALRAAGEAGLPLISDVPGLPIPGLESSPTKDAKTLSALIAMEAMKVVLPTIPLLRPEDLMEFREENRAHLRGFRRAMLRYAGAWRSQLANATPEEIAQETKFLVETEIVPALDELRQLASDPARPWHKRALDGVRIIPSVAGTCMSMGPGAALTQLLTALAPQFFTEVEAKGDKQRQLRRSDLYYLLQVQRAGE